MGLLSRRTPRKWDAGWWSGQWAPTPVSICHSAMKSATSGKLETLHSALNILLQNSPNFWNSRSFQYFSSNDFRICGLTAMFRQQYARITSQSLRFMDPQEANASTASLQALDLAQQPAARFYSCRRRCYGGSSCRDSARNGMGQMAGNVPTAIATQEVTVFRLYGCSMCHGWPA